MNPISYKIKNAVVSVSDKTGIIEFCSELQNLGIEIFSTGGTLKHLLDSGIKAKSISEITNFPEILDGRLKTLHPAIHGGLLAELDKEEHLAQMKENNISSIDMIVVNLYPFEKKLKDSAEHSELVENIDIGGPTMLRSAAKNYKWSAPIVNPDRYKEVIDILQLNNMSIPNDYRIKLAGEVFAYTAQYDSFISNYFIKYNQIETPEKFTISKNLVQSLRYGENPHQKAALYGDFNQLFEKLHGKELSYNNILDINSAAQIILEFEEPSCAIIKHTNPCGVATANNINDAYKMAFSTDTVSPFGGIIVFNREVDVATATTIHDIFTELIIAPSFSSEAMDILTKKRDRRLIKSDFGLIKQSISKDYRSVVGGLLVQDNDKYLLDNDKMNVVTNRKPSPSQMRAILFAWKVCKHVKSNAIVYANENQTLAIGAGQMSRVDSSRIAVEKAKLMNLELKGCVIASDAFFPFSDGLIEANQAGAIAVIQPGGSVRDNEVIEEANLRNMTMIFTGIRHFRH